MAVEATHHAAEAIPELPNLITLLSQRWHEAPWVAWLHQWENLFFSAGAALVLCVLTWRYSRRPATIPTGWQNLLELFVEGVDQFVARILGKEGRYFTPFIGTLFLYIWLMNLSVLVPFLKSSTSNLNTTAALAILVFSYVQWTGMRRLGFLGYLDHLAGSPRYDHWWMYVAMSPVMIIMFAIHVLGEFIKPLSLSLRLCFNVFAEDVLLAVMVGLGIGISVGMHLPGWLPVPLQLFVIPLVLIFSTVQALVFSLLSSVYIALMLPHGEARH